MRALDAIKGFFAILANRLMTRRRMAHFKCGDCETSERCGQLPTDDCIARAAQIERDGDKSHSTSPRVYQASY